MKPSIEIKKIQNNLYKNYVGSHPEYEIMGKFIGLNSYDFLSKAIIVYLDREHKKGLKIL
jgi:hypothetical protein